MNKLDMLRGIGSLYLDDDLIGKAEYEISINRDEEGETLAFGWMLVSKQVIEFIKASVGDVGDYSFRFEKGEKVELVLGELSDITMKFDVSGRVPGF